MGKSSDHLSTSKYILLGGTGMFVVMLATMPVSPAHAALTAFMAAAALCGWVASRGLLKGVAVERRHRPRVFEDDRVPVTLAVRQTAGHPQTLVVVEDQFYASLSIRQRHLIPMLTRQWEAHLHYNKEAERHRGIYMLGPIEVWAADPLGLFARRIELDCVTPLTVYPKAVPLPGYRLLGPHPPAGPTLEAYHRIGQGEEIISVRPYQPGDSPSRVHWRTSARRGALHTIELDTHVQGEIMIFADLTRRSRYGTGAESTTEMAIGCATAILTQAADLRHRIGMTLVREKVELFPPGEGLSHLHLLLDRLAVVSPEGELKFWEQAERCSATLRHGARAIFIAAAATTPPLESCALIRKLTLRSIAVDVILIDEGTMTRIWRDQPPPLMDAPAEFARLQSASERSGARVLPLARGETAGNLLPRGLN